MDDYQETLEVTRRSAVPGTGIGGGAAAPSTLSRTNSMQRTSMMKGLEGGKLTAAVRQAAAASESRHLCFEQARWGHAEGRSLGVL